MKNITKYIRISEKHVVVFLVGTILFLAGMYGFLVSSSIVNVVVRKEIEQEISRSYSRMSEIESEYLLLTNAITPSLAHELGFSDIQNKVFVTRTSVTRNELTLNQ